LALQLETSEREFIKKTLKKLLPKARFLVFGSRFTGEAKRYSDLDIAIDDKNPIELSILSKLEEIFANSDLIFKVDIIDFHRVTPEFQQRILKASQEL
jgi:predicted nucleotidyltransferase